MPFITEHLQFADLIAVNNFAKLFVWSGTRKRSNVLRVTPEQLGASYQDITFFSCSPDQVKLSGWLIPARLTPKAVLILCHGHTSTRLEMLRRAVTLSSHHFTTLLFDFRARGMSEGNRCTLGWQEQFDVLGAVRHLKSIPELSSLPLVALGNSMGGAAAILAAAGTDHPGNTNSVQIDAVIAEAAFASLNSAVEQRAGVLAGPFGRAIAAQCNEISMQEIGLDINCVSPAEVISRISPRPVFLITDGLDITCTRHQSDRLYAAARAPKERWIVAGCPHSGAYILNPTRYIERVVSFVDRVVVSVKSIPDPVDSPGLC